jgi:SOS-response transcriptional repressor LexA
MAKGIYKSNIKEIFNAEIIDVPIYTSAFMAGEGVNIMDGIESQTIPKLEGVKKDGCYLVRASGDSMSPKINAQDLILIDTDVTQYRPGDIVAVCLNGDYIIKVYEPGSMCLYLSSLNQNYEPIRVYADQDDCMIIGKATKIIREI